MATAFPLGRIPNIQVLFLLSDLLLIIPLVWIGLRYLGEPQQSSAAVPATA